MATTATATLSQPEAEAVNAPTRNIIGTASSLAASVFAWIWGTLKAVLINSKTGALVLMVGSYIAGGFGFDTVGGPQFGVESRDVLKASATTAADDVAKAKAVAETAEKARVAAADQATSAMGKLRETQARLEAVSATAQPTDPAPAKVAVIRVPVPKIVKKSKDETTAPCSGVFSCIASGKF